MFENIMCILIFLFSVIGIVQTVKCITQLILIPHNQYRKFTIIPMRGHTENAELILRYEAQFHDRKKNHKFIVADYGLDEETAEICHRLANLGIIDNVIPLNQLILDIENTLNSTDKKD